MVRRSPWPAGTADGTQISAASTCTIRSRRNGLHRGRVQLGDRRCLALPRRHEAPLRGAAGALFHIGLYVACADLPGEPALAAGLYHFAVGPDHPEAVVLRRLRDGDYRRALVAAPCGEPAVAAGCMYLAAYAQRFAATGLTFYDDAVTDFFAPHAAGKSVMFLIALGHNAKRSRS